MLFRLVRPVKRTGSRYRQFVRRIPSEVRSKATGLKLSIPVGGQAQVVIISPRAQSVRLSLRTDDPAEVKIRLAEVDAYLENVWRALREDAPVSADLETPELSARPHSCIINRGTRLARDAGVT